MHQDELPSTHGTWMFDLLSSGPEGERIIRRRVMEVYYPALMAYARRAIRAQRIDTEELVNSFIASRLERPGYFEDWQASGLSFRRWLINGLHFCAREMAKSRPAGMRRPHGEGTQEEAHAVEDAEPLATDSAADHAFEREVALQVIARAARVVHSALVDRNRAEDWTWFCRHHIDRVPYGLLSQRSGRSARELNGMIRAVTGDLRKAVRIELLREGLANHEIEGELRRIQEVLKP